MSSLNQCNFIGYMAADPETRAMASGESVTNFRIAVGEKWKDKQSGELREKTEWISCVAWRNTAEVVAQYGHKGMQVFVSGKFTTEKWKDKKSGEDRYTSKITVNEFKMLGKKSDNEGGGQRTTGNQNNTNNRQQSNTAPTGGFDDDIPF